MVGPEEKNFQDALAGVINRHSIENASNTPDFILALFVQGCLAAFADAVRAREKWYGHKHAPGQMTQPGPMGTPPPEGTEDIQVTMRVPTEVAMAIRSGQLQGVSMSGQATPARIAQEEPQDG